MSLKWILILCFEFLVILAIAVYEMPVEKCKRKKKQAEKTPRDMKQKEAEWEEKKSRYDNQLSALKQEIDRLNSEMKKKDEEILHQKSLTKKGEEKLDQERGWRNKEEDDLRKLKDNEIRLKEMYEKAEETLSREHAHKIRLQREIDELKKVRVSFTEDNRQQGVRIIELEKSLKDAQKQLRETKWENAEFKKKKDAEQWVAKYDYDAIVDKLHVKEKEIERLQKAIDAQSPFKKEDGDAANEPHH